MGNLLKSDVLDIDQFVVEDRKRAQKEPRKRQSRSRTRFKYRHSQSPASCCITNNIVGESPEKDSREAEQDLNIDTVNHQPPVASQIILWERNLPGWQDFCSIGSWAKYFYNFFFHDPTVSRPHSAVNASTGSLINVTFDLEMSDTFPALINTPIQSKSLPEVETTSFQNLCQPYKKCFSVHQASVHNVY